ncbi:hypothetical protein JTB14_030362 [Gonioctena quinquepunctata]|nr:hypothetical protein JTB14_030362 [Gonioctena quinquepunctata]
MLNVKALEQRQNDILKLDNATLPNFNLGDVKSDAFYRKVRSEAFAKNDRDKDDIAADIIEMQAAHPNYIQFVGVPLHIYIYSVEQLALLSMHKDAVLHIDPTGLPCSGNGLV